MRKGFMGVAGFTLVLVLVAFGLLAGCSRQGTDEGASGGKTMKLRSVDDATVRAVLAKADLVDGTADRVVEKCANCGLHMDGSPEHTMTVSGYTLQFCSESCRTSFGTTESEAKASVAALKVPEPVSDPDDF